MNLMKRRIEINGQEFMVFGKAPWITVNVPKIAKIDACAIIIESRLATMIFSNPDINPHRYNALTKLGQKGAMIPVAFIGESGKARAEDIIKKLNDKLDK